MRRFLRTGRARNSRTFQKVQSYLFIFFPSVDERLFSIIRPEMASPISNVEKITSAILPLASNILFPPLPFRLFSNLFSVTMLALLLRISSKIAQKCRCKIAELILSTLLNAHAYLRQIFFPFVITMPRWFVPALCPFRL